LETLLPVMAHDIVPPQAMTTVDDEVRTGSLASRFHGGVAAGSCRWREEPL